MIIKTISTKADIVRRSKGQNAVDKAAYISRTTIKCERTGETFYPKYSEDLVHSEVMIPEGAPDELNDRSVLWNSIENIEKRKDAQVARTFRICLPNEWSYELATDTMRKYVEKNFVSQGMCCDFAIHDSENKRTHQRNLHCHIMLTMRPLNKDGTWGEKQRAVYELDENGERIKKKNGRYKTHTEKTTDWDSKEKAVEWRKNLADTINYVNQQMGNTDITWDHRSFKERGLDIVPEIHMGPKVAALEAKGIHTEIGDTNRTIREHNRTILEAVKAVQQAEKYLETVTKNVAAAVRKSTNEILSFLDRLSQKFGRLILPVRTGIYLGKVSNRNVLQDIEKAKKFLEDRNITTFAELEKFKGTQEEMYKQCISERDYLNHDIHKLDELIDYYENMYLPVRKCYLQSENLKGWKKRAFDEEHRSELDIYETLRNGLFSRIGKDGKITPKAWNKKLDELYEQRSELEKKLAKEIVNLAFAETIIYNRDNYSYLNPSLDNEEHTRNTVRIGKKLETTRAKVQKREETMEQISTERKKKNRDKSIDD